MLIHGLYPGSVDILAILVMTFSHVKHGEISHSLRAIFKAK